MKKIAILGSSGSIGSQAVQVIEQFKERFEVVALAVFSDAETLLSQIKSLNPKTVAVVDEKAAETLKGVLDSNTGLLSGKESLTEIACLDDVDVVLNALVGAAGLEATLAALEAGKTLALANKESMVVGGEIIKEIKKKKPVKIIPVDSEHSAIFQCFLGENKEEANKIILTSSGGPFRKSSVEEIKKATLKQALAHPRWKMGPKITIDSATLANKGLEVIEAHYLFDFAYEDIEVIIHPQSIIHSMVEFVDGSIKAHLGQTDMKIPIQYALSYPQRLRSPLEYLSLIDVAELTFEKPDYQKFPSLKLGLESGKMGKTYPTVFNAANEVGVDKFINNQIPFDAIWKTIEKCLEKHEPLDASTLENVKIADSWARQTALQV